MPNNTIDSSGYENAFEPDPIKALLREICIVFANGTSFCARLIAIHNDNELWFESRNPARRGWCSAGW